MGAGLKGALEGALESAADTEEVASETALWGSPGHSEQSLQLEAAEALQATDRSGSLEGARLSWKPVLCLLTS